MTLSGCRALTLAMAALCVVSTSVFAQDDGPPPGYAAQGTYIGIEPLINTTFDGITFDGQGVYQEIGGPQIGILPKLDRKNTLRVVVGFRSRPLALEFSYERATHGGTFLGLPVDSVSQAFNIDSRWFFNTAHRLQPHILIGLSFPLLTVKDGVTDGVEIGDARWRATGLNTEVGVSYFVTPHAGVSVGYAYRP